MESKFGGILLRAIMVLAIVLLTLQLSIRTSLGQAGNIARVQIVQALANQSGKYVAGKNSAIVVTLNEAVDVDPTQQTVVVKRGNATVATLSAAPSDSQVTTLTFVCPSMAACGNWAVGAYTFTANINGETASASATFQTRKKISILAVPIKANYGGQVRQTTGAWKKMGEFTRSVYPLAANDFQWTLGPEVDASGSGYDLTTADDAGRDAMFAQVVKAQPAACLETPRPSGLQGCYDKVVGFVKDRMGATGNLQGFTMGSGTNIVVESDEDAMATVAHEIGHNFQLGDEYNSGTYNCVVNPPVSSFVGSNILPPNESGGYSCTNSPSVLFPGTEENGANLISTSTEVPFEVGGRGLLPDVADFMGSGAPQSSIWISAAGWKTIFDGLAPAQISADSIRLAGPTAPSRWINALGFIGQDDSVSLEPWYDFDDEGNQANSTGHYTLQALGTNDAVLASTDLAVDFTVVDGPATLSKALFNVVMPFPAGTTKFRILHDSTTLKDVAVSANAPTVQVVSPATGETVPSGEYTVHWQGADADGNQLHYDVEYSDDNGATWDLVAADLTSAQTSVDFGELGGTNNALIRVTATDGANSSEAVSAPFVVLVKAPEAVIVAPANNTSFSEGDLVWLEGVGFDAQDEDITEDAQLAWSSNIQGALGNGQELALTDLQVGQHVITLTVTNSAGLTASASETITVRADASFIDVTASDYFYQPVRALYARGAISGYSDNTFRPFNTTTRGQLVKIVVSALELPIQSSGTATFMDVPTDNAFYQFVQTAAARGIISGYSDTAHCGANAPCFKPNDNVTRGQVAKIVTAAAGWQLINPANPSFSDVPTSNPFYSSIETARAHNVISGYSCGGSETCPGTYFRPANPVTRGQLAKIVYLASPNR